MSEPLPPTDLPIYSGEVPSPPSPDPAPGTDLLSEELRREMRLAADNLDDAEVHSAAPAASENPRLDFLLTDPQPAGGPVRPFSPKVIAAAESTAPALSLAGDVSLRALAESLIEPASVTTSIPVPASPVPPAAPPDISKVEAQEEEDTRLLQNAPPQLYPLEAVRRADPAEADAISDRSGIDFIAAEFVPDTAQNGAAEIAEASAVIPVDKTSEALDLIPEDEYESSRETVILTAAAVHLLSAAQESAAAERAEAKANDSPGLVIFGALFVVCGLVTAWEVPALVMAGTSVAAGMAVLTASGAALLLTLGLGAATARRWAPPLVHAAGWVVLLSCLLVLAQYSALLFTSDHAGIDLHSSLGRLGFVTLAGVVLPLAAIAYFDRQQVLETCAAADPRPRWTDALPVPVIMLSLTAGTAAAICAAAAAARLPFPPDASGKYSPAWWAAGAGWAAAAWLSSRNRPSGWFACLGLFIIMTGLTVPAFRSVPLNAALKNEAGAEFAAWAALLLPLLAILLMSRKSFMVRHADEPH